MMLCLRRERSHNQLEASLDWSFARQRFYGRVVFYEQKEPLGHYQDVLGLQPPH